MIQKSLFPDIPDSEFPPKIRVVPHPKRKAAPRPAVQPDIPVEADSEFKLTVLVGLEQRSDDTLWLVQRELAYDRNGILIRVGPEESAPHC